MKVTKETAARETAIAGEEVQLCLEAESRTEWVMTLEHHVGAYDRAVLADERGDPIQALAAGEAELHAAEQPYELAEQRSEDWVAWAMDQIRSERLRLEYAKIRAAAIVRAAERREQYVYGLLWPACAYWAEAHPPKRGRSIAVEGTDLKLQWRRSPDSLRVTDEAAAIRWLEDHVGFEAAQIEGFTRIKEEVSVSAVKSALKAGRFEAPPDGMMIVEGQDKLHLSKTKGTK